MMKKIFEPQSSLHHSSLLGNLVLILALLLALFPLQSVQAAAGPWEMTGAMNTARYGHTATLLPDGKVLVVGGMGIAGALASTELYDPDTGLWTLTGSLAVARLWHTATLLKDGKVLVAGGANISGVLDSAELYDPATGQWTPSGVMVVPHKGHSATLLTNGKVLVVGGRGVADPAVRAELYDPATGTWSATGLMKFPDRLWNTATLLPDGKVLVVGGLGLPVCNNPELYDPLTDTWTLNNSYIACSIYGLTATTLSNGVVLVVHGLQSESYDPATGTWYFNEGLLREPRMFHAAVLLSNGNVMVVGGELTSTDGYSSAELFDPVYGGWRFAGWLNEVRIKHTLTMLKNGKVLAAGGYGANIVILASAELFTMPDPVTISGNTVTGGVKLSYTDIIPKLAISDSSGNYSITVPANWSGTVTPFILGGPSFNPDHRTYTDLTADMTGQDYVPAKVIKPSFVSIAAQDGYILESSENGGVGKWLNKSSAAFIVGDDSLNRQYRSIISFNTVFLPTRAVVMSATLKLKKQGGAGTDPFRTLGPLVVDIKTGSFGANPALQLGDFNALPSLNTAGLVSPNPLNGWYTSKLAASSLKYVSKGGFTQLRLRFRLDDDNDKIADWLAFYSGDAMAGYRPVLEVNYYVP
jgi:hypothetical protein